MPQRRHPGSAPHLAALRGDFSPEKWRYFVDTLLPALEKFLNRGVVDGFSGAPTPHQDTHLAEGSDPLQTPDTPTTVDAGSSADAGEGPSYAYEDHEHAVTTGTAAALGEAEAEGSGVALARASHIHKLATRVAKDGTTIGTRKRINLSAGVGGSLTVTDDSTNDEVDIVIGGQSNPNSSVESLDDWYTRKAVEAYALRETIATSYR